VYSDCTKNNMIFMARTWWQTASCASMRATSHMPGIVSSRWQKSAEKKYDSRHSTKLITVYTSVYLLSTVYSTPDGVE
jgi:hypothetical protein